MKSPLTSMMLKDLTCKDLAQKSKDNIPDPQLLSLRFRLGRGGETGGRQGETVGEKRSQPPAAAPGQESSRSCFHPSVLPHPLPGPHLFSFPGPGGLRQGWGSDVNWNLFNFTSHCACQLASSADGGN